MSQHVAMTPKDSDGSSIRKVRIWSAEIQLPKDKNPFERMLDEACS